MVGNHIVTQSSFTSVPRYDRRLLFKDLNDNSILNGVNTEELLTLWTPELQFLNALGLDLDIYHVMLILVFTDRTLPDQGGRPECVHHPVRV